MISSVRLRIEPQLLTAVNSRLFFSAWATDTGQELWTTDGTAAGTRKITELPGRLNSFSRYTAFQGRFYFSLDIPGEDTELWVSDATQAGTGAVLDRGLHPVRAVTSLRALSHHLYFTRSDTTQNLWQTDGSAKGTVPVSAPAAASFAALAPLWSAGSRLFFSGYDSMAGIELWALGPD